MSTRNHEPLTLETTYTVTMEPMTGAAASANPTPRDPSDPFRVYPTAEESMSHSPRRAPPYSPSRRAQPATAVRYKRPLLDRIEDFFDLKPVLMFLAGVVAVLALAAAVSQFFPWVLPLVVIAVVVAIAAAGSDRPLVPCVWAAAVALLSVVAFTLDSTLKFLVGFDDLLCNWMTYRVIAGVVLFFLVSVPICAFFERVCPVATPDTAAPAPDPRGYGRYAIDDFVEKSTYGDAQLASKGNLHLALSRKGNENLRFTPKFYE